MSGCKGGYCDGTGDPTGCTAHHCFSGSGILVFRDNGQKIGVASKYVVPFFSDGFPSFTDVGRILFHSPTLGYDLNTPDCTDLLSEETLVIEARRYAIASYHILCQSGSVLFAEGLRLIPDTRPADRGPHPVPKNWLAL